LVVGNYFYLFVQFFRYFGNAEHLLVVSGDEVDVLHSLEIAVGDYACRIIEFHTDGVGVKGVGDTEFGVLFKITHPNVGTVWEGLS
jgi:hypothetical protein